LRLFGARWLILEMANFSCRFTYILSTVAITAASATTGCASLAFKPAIQSIGEYKNTAKVADAAQDMAEHTADDVKVLIESLPDGMSAKDGMITYDHEMYELLGKVTADYKDPGLANMGFWFYGYKQADAWRTALCAWQVPLSWITFTVWSWLSPTYYPCRVKVGDEEVRRGDILETLQRATKALGGNLVVVSGFGGVNFLTVRGGAVVSSSAVSTLNGTGFAFRVLAKLTKGVAPVKGAVKL
jgi:hypothetical protein